MIKVNDICAGYGGIEILHGISFTIKDNESLSIIGPNGCGKTTLLRAIAGTLPSTGKIEIDGQDIKSIKRKVLARKVAMLSQLTRLYFNYTVQETVMMGRFVHASRGLLGGVSEEDKNVVTTVLETVGMLDSANRGVDTLSGGQLQRVFLAKVLAQDPDVILLDEPTNHLDLSYQIELIRFLKEWSKRKGKSVIGVLHDINLAMLLSDNVLLMENGQVKSFGKTKEVFTADILSSAYKMDVVGYMLEILRKWEYLIGRDHL